MPCRLEPIACGSPRYAFTDRCPRTSHQRSQVGQGLQRLGHADDALDVGGVETALGAVSELGETLLAIHRIGNRASVMTAGFAEHASVRQPHSGHSPVSGGFFGMSGLRLMRTLPRTDCTRGRERRSVAERVDIDPPVGNRHCTAIGEIELAIETAAGGPLMAGSLVASRNFQFEIRDVLGTKVVSLPQSDSRFDRPLHEDLSRITLDVESGVDELKPCAEIACELIPFESVAKERFDETSP